MTTSILAPLSQDEQLFYQLIWQPMVSAGETWLEGAVPFLNLPVIKELDEGTIKIITDALFNQLVLLVDIEAIQLINTAHQTAYDNASLQLKIIAEEKGTDSNEYQTALQVALTDLSQFTDIAHP